MKTKVARTAKPGQPVRQAGVTFHTGGRLKGRKSTKAKKKNDFLAEIKVREAAIRIRNAALNKAMGDIADLAEKHGITLDLSGSGDPMQTVSMFCDVTEAFYTHGDTNKDLIDGCRGFLKRLAHRINALAGELANLTPTPLPTGLYVRRDSAGAIINRSLYPYYEIPEGCTETFEPGDGVIPAK